MADASYVQSSFAGGEVSQFYQGRYDRQDYRTFMATCLNGFPTETGSWARRGGTQFAGTTRSGNKGRVLKWDFAQSTSYVLEWTDGFLRFWQGTQIQFNAGATVSSITTDSPAKVNTVEALSTVGYTASGKHVMFVSGLGSALPLLQNRRFVITITGSNQFTIADAITGAAIDGSTLGVGSLPAGVRVLGIIDLPTPYSNGAWSSIRIVQAETKAVVLNGAVPPYMLQATATPAPLVGAGFTLNQAVLNDGPYLDPPNNGALVTPGTKSGIVTLTLGFPAYDSTKAYKIGDFVTSAAVNYQSLVDQNVGNTPLTSPSQWQPVSAGAAINNGLGILGTDIGRLVRLYSEPAAWASGSTYAQGAVVSYNPSGIPGATTYWGSQAGGNTGNVPGTDLTHWTLLVQGGTSSPALWTWGKITGLANFIAAATGTAIGTMTGGGGVAAAFNGTTGQNAAASASLTQAALSVDGYVGKNYTGAGGEAIDHATVYPSTDQGLFTSTNTFGTLVNNNLVTSVVLNLRGKNTAPASASDGTVLGTVTLNANTFSAVNIVSTSSATWQYVWVEINATFQLDTHFAPGNESTSIYAAQVQFFNPPGTGAGAAFNVEILGPALLYTNAITNWRLGVYSNTTGYPTNGVYHSGRLWLGGAVDNRFDCSVSNAISSTSGLNISFAPTDQYGNVLASSGISAVFNDDSVNPLRWMKSQQQGIVCGTQAGEWLIFAPTAGSIAPNNIDVRKLTKSGCANVEPRETEHTLVFVQRYGKKLIEYFPDVFSGKYTAPNLAEKAMHLTAKGVAELAYCQAVTPIIWYRDNAGNLRGITYKRDTLMTSQGPTLAGHHRHALGSGRIVESITAGPSTGGDLDSLTMITNDTATGVRHVEILTDMVAEGSTLAQASYLDDAVAPTSTVQLTPAQLAPYGGLTLNGLWHLNGKTVQAWIGGIDCGLQEGGIAAGKYTDFTVANGSITIPFGDSVSAGPGAGLFTAALVATAPPMVVGFTYNSDGQVVRPHAPQESGARSGPGFMKLRRSHYIGFQLEGSNGLSYGTSFAALKPALVKQADGQTNILNNAQFTGIFRDNPSDSDTFDSLPCWRFSRPYIGNVIAVGAALQTKDI